MTISTLTAWLLATMLFAAPPGRSRIKDAQETGEDGAARYGAIARDIATVTLDPAEDPLPTTKANARARTAALVAAVALHEGGFRRDVDLGVGPLSRGDGGRSCTLWQFNLGAEGKTRDGWDCKALLADRALAARAALHAIRASALAKCPGGPEGWLRVYGGGSCATAVEGSREVVKMSRRWMARRPFPVDADPAPAAPSSSELAFRAPAR